MMPGHRYNAKGTRRIGGRCLRLRGPVCWIAAAIVSAGSASGQTDPNRSTSPAMSGELARRLWETRISLPESGVDAQAKSNLRNLIQQVRSLQFEGNEVTPSFSGTEQAGATVDPNRTPVQQPKSVPTPTPTADLEIASPGSLLPATLDHLEQVAQTPEQVSNPLEVAELLFISGYTVEAIPFYESALARTSRTDESTRSDRAWILFQLANCLRDTDMTRARDTYQKLVAEHADSPWGELARARGRIITWYLTSKPEQLLAAP